MSGRKHHQADRGFRFDVYSSRISACRPEGKTLFVERYVLEPHKHPLNGVGVMGPFDVFGNVILLTPPEHHQRILDRIAPQYDEVEGSPAASAGCPTSAG